MTFASARDTCPFCDKTILSGKNDEIVFPAPVRKCLTKFDASAISVKYDFLRGVLIKDPEGELMLQDQVAPNNLSLLIPRVTRFQTKEDFYSHYQRFYDCNRPAVGEVWLQEPALAERVDDGWLLREKGLLEVR